MLPRQIRKRWENPATRPMPQTIQHQHPTLKQHRKAALIRSTGSSFCPTKARGSTSCTPHPLPPVDKPTSTTNLRPPPVTGCRPRTAPASGPLAARRPRNKSLVHGPKTPHLHRDDSDVCRCGPCWDRGRRIEEVQGTIWGGGRATESSRQPPRISSSPFALDPCRSHIKHEFCLAFYALGI